MKVGICLYLIFILGVFLPEVVYGNANIQQFAARVPKAARQVPIPKDMRPVRNFSWFPDSQKIVMRLAQRIAVVEVESGNVKILSEPNIKHCNPECAPDGRTIAYIGPMGENSTIWLMDVNGENKRPLVNLKCWHRPVWSPDSKQLAFTSGWEIWVVNAEGAGLRQLTFGPGARSRPKWSPNGNLIAFLVNDTIWLMNADGSNQRLLTEIVSERGYGPIGDWDDFFDWSPDGKQIVYAYRPIPPKGQHITHDGGIHPYQIWVINIDGTNKRCLTPEDISCGYPIWMPGKTHILYESVYKWVVTARLNIGVTYPKQNIWMVDLSGNQRKQLTNVEMIDEFAVSPDGRKIIFSTGNQNLFVLENFFSNASQSTIDSNSIGRLDSSQSHIDRRGGFSSSKIVQSPRF